MVTYLVDLKLLHNETNIYLNLYDNIVALSGAGTPGVYVFPFNLGNDGLGVGAVNYRSFDTKPVVEFSEYFRPIRLKFKMKFLLVINGQPTDYVYHDVFLAIKNTPTTYVREYGLRINLISGSYAKQYFFMKNNPLVDTNYYDRYQGYTSDDYYQFANTSTQTVESIDATWYMDIYKYVDDTLYAYIFMEIILNGTTFTYYFPKFQITQTQINNLGFIDSTYSVTRTERTRAQKNITEYEI